MSVRDAAMNYSHELSEPIRPTGVLRKSFCGPKTNFFQQLDRRVYEYVIENQNEGMSITRAVIQLTALKVIKQVNPLAVGHCVIVIIFG